MRAGGTGVPRSLETPTPLRAPWVPRHRATEGSYGGGGSYERGIPVGTWARAGRVGMAETMVAEKCWCRSGTPYTCL